VSAPLTVLAPCHEANTGPLRQGAGLLTVLVMASPQIDDRTLGQAWERHRFGSCIACGSLPLSSALLGGVDWGFSPRRRSAMRGCFAVPSGLERVEDPSVFAEAAQELWGLSAGLPATVRHESLLGLRTTTTGRRLLTALMREEGRHVLAEFLAVERGRLSVTERRRRGREVASLLVENLGFLESWPLDHESVWVWSGTGVWLLRNFAGFLPQEMLRGLPVSPFFVPPHPGTGPCVTGEVFATCSALPAPSREVFSSLLPEWSGTLAELERLALLLP
jgi:hypothetical protein